MTLYTLAYLRHKQGMDCGEALRLADAAGILDTYPARLAEIRVLTFAREQNARKAPFLLGCLLGGMARRTGSILAPMLMHGCYNAAVLLLGFAGASFAGRSLLFCALGLLSAVL